MNADNLTMAGQEQKSTKVSLEVLAKMTGFPIEMIMEEVFKGNEEQEVSLEDLRSAMLSYIDSTMLMAEEK
jgi:hypothetical protein